MPDLFYIPDDIRLITVWLACEQNIVFYKVRYAVGNNAFVTNMVLFEQCQALEEQLKSAFVEIGSVLDDVRVFERV